MHSSVNATANVLLTLALSPLSNFFIYEDDDFIFPQKHKGDFHSFNIKRDLGISF